jgi:cellobiose-specific phosphotransferase system component IIC
MVVERRGGAGMTAGTIRLPCVRLLWAFGFYGRSAFMGVRLLWAFGLYGGLTLQAAAGHAWLVVVRENVMRLSERQDAALRLLA